MRAGVRADARDRGAAARSAAQRARRRKRRPRSADARPAAIARRPAATPRLSDLRRRQQRDSAAARDSVGATRARARQQRDHARVAGKERQRRQRRAADARAGGRRKRAARQRQRERARGALGREHPCGKPRQPRLGVEIARQSRPVERDRAAAAGAFERLREPAGAARDGFPCDALQRIAALVVAQSGEVGFVAASLRARIEAVSPGRQRRRRRLPAPDSDAGEREVHVSPAAPQPSGCVRRQRDAAERDASARRRRHRKRHRRVAPRSTAVRCALTPFARDRDAATDRPLRQRATARTRCCRRRTRRSRRAA